MKTFSLLLIISISIVTFGQQKSPTKPFKEWQAFYYLDSVQVDLSRLHFDPDKILTINVVHQIDSTRQVNGKIYISSKYPKGYNFLSLSDILNKNCKDCCSPKLFILDNVFLKDTSRIKIDSSYILNVEIMKGSDFDYLKKSIPNLTILKILTKTKENLAKKNQIRLR